MADLTQDQLEQLKADAVKKASIPGYALPSPPAAPDGSAPGPVESAPITTSQGIGMYYGNTNPAVNAAVQTAGQYSGGSMPWVGENLKQLPGYQATDGATAVQTPQVQRPAQTPAQTGTAPAPNEFSNAGTNIPEGYRAPVVQAEPSDDELNQKSSDELFRYFSGTDNLFPDRAAVNPDRAAAFWQQKKNAELNNQSAQDRSAMLWNDLSNTWNHLVQTGQSILPNTLNFFGQTLKSIGGSGDDLLQIFGNQNAIDYHQDLDGKLANNTIDKPTYDQKIALVNQAQDLQNKLVYEKLSPQEQQATKAQIATLLTQSDSDFAQHQQSKAFQQFFTGLNLTKDKVMKVGQAIENLNEYGLETPGFDWQKYFTGKDSAASWPAQKLSNYFQANRQFNQPVSQGESGQVPGWVKGFNQWDLDWKKRMGWLPTGAEYASPQQLALEGSPLSLQRIQDTSDVSSLALQTLLDPALDVEGSMGLASSKLLGGAAKLGVVGPAVAGGLQKFWNSGAVSAFRQQLAGYEAFFQHDPLLAGAWMGGGALANLGLGAYRRWGHLAGDVLDDAAKMNFEQGGPMSLLSRGARLTSDSVVHSLPYALLNSDGDANRFWDNVTTLAPLHFAARAVPQVGQAVGTELGDNLFGRLGEFKDTTPINYPDPDPSLNAHSRANLQDVPIDEKNQFATLQHFQNGNTQMYLVTPQVLDDYQARFGGDAQPRPYGFWVGPDRTGTGQGAAFVLKDRIKEAAAHEATHGVFFSASKAEQEALMNNALKYNDPDQFIRDHYNQDATYASLPEDPPSADPTMLNKKMVRTEMAVESLKQWFNARNAEQYKGQNPLLRSVRMVAGNWLERMGIPTQTFKSTSEMGINPYFANGLLSDGLWRKAAKGYQMNPTDPRWPVGNWPLNPGDTWDTTGRPPPRTPPPTPTTPTPTTTATPTTPPPTTPPNAPPAQEAIARRAYEISQEREATGAAGDHVSDWLQAENELRGGKAGPKTGPEAPAPETPGSTSPEYHAQLEELIEKGVPAGEAQAIVEGRQPKSLEQEKNPPQMPGRLGPKPIVSSPKPVWGPGAGIFGTAANVLSPPMAIGAQRAQEGPPPAPSGQPVSTTGAPSSDWNVRPGEPAQVTPSQVEPTNRIGVAQEPAKKGYLAPPLRTQQEPAQEPAKKGYLAPPLRTQQPAEQPKEEAAPEQKAGPQVSDEFVDPRVDAIWNKAQGKTAIDEETKLPVKGSTREVVPPMAQPRGGPDTSRTMRATWFGRNPDGSVDTTDERTMSYYNAHHGAWGADLLNPNLKGVAVSPAWLRANGIDPKKSPGSQGYKVRVTAPNGNSEVVDIVDLGPRNTVDMTYGLGKSLGLTDNSRLKVELLDHQGKSVALKDEPQGGGGKEVGAATGGLQGGGGEEVPYSALPAMPAQEGTQPSAVPGMEEAQREGAATGGYGGGYAEEPATHMTPFASMYPFGMPSAAQMRAPMTQGEAMQQAQYGAAGMQQAPAAPGGGGLYYMRGPRKGGAPEEEGAPESTLGEPMPKGIEKVLPQLSQGLAGLKQAQQEHAKLLSPDDTRVRQQGSGSSARFKGEHFVPGDPVHAAALASVPDDEKRALAAGQTAIQNRQPMHMTYLSAPPARETPISRQSRAIDYDESSPEARLLGTTQGRLAGHSVIPLSVGVSLPRKKGDPNRGYIEGISTSAAAHNHALMNEALGMAGEPTPYPELRTPKFRNDLRGYVQNLLAGHSGTGDKYQVGTEDYPAKPDRNYVPYRLKRREADFMNAILNNQRARTTPAVRELAQKAGTLLSPEGEVNPLRESIDREEIKDPQLKHAANERWSKNILEPTIRTFKAGLIKSLHEDPGSIPADLRQNVAAYRKLTQTLSKEMGQKRGWPDIPTAVNFMPAPLSPEEHQELTGNIRKQFISGKLRPKDYLERVSEVPEPGEPLGGVQYMPMAGKKARGFAQAEKEGRTFETPLEPGGQRFEIDDRDMKFRPNRLATPVKGMHDLPRNALEERYQTDRRGPGILRLMDAVDHPELFENYPHLKMTKISMDPTIPHYGHYQQPYIDEQGNPRGDHVVLRDPTDKETLAHELQHAVQVHEDFAGKGANAQDVFNKLMRDPGVKDELRKQWDAAYPERAEMKSRPWAENEVKRLGWQEQRIREMAQAMYQMDPGEVEARVAGQRAIGLTPEQKEEARAEIPAGEQISLGEERALQERTPKEDVLEEMRNAAAQGRQAGTMSARYRLPEGGGIAYMAAPKKAKEPVPPREISQETLDKIGPKPEDPAQAKLWQQVGDRLDSQVKGAIPLEPDMSEEGKFKTEPNGKPKYKKTNYDIANSPLLQKEGKALGLELNKRTGKMGMAKPPKDVEDDLEKLDPEKRLTPYLNPTDRKRVSHLNDISAVDTYADKLHEMYKSIEHLPEVMGGKDWYDEAKTWLEHHFGAHSDLVANLLAATSPGNKVKINYGMAIKAYHQFLRGAFDKHIDLYRKAYKIKQSGEGALIQHVLDNGIHTALGEAAPKSDEAAMEQYIEHHGITPRNEEGALFGHNSIHVLKVLAHTWEKEAGGPKAPNFAANLNGRSLQATIDMWAARTMRRLGYEGHTDEPWLIQPAGETGVNDVDFGLSQLAFKKAAERIGIKPSSLQAILWFAEQKHWQKNGWERTQDAEDRDYRPMLKAYQRAPDITQAQYKKAEKLRQKVVAEGA